MLEPPNTLFFVLLKKNYFSKTKRRMKFQKVQQKLYGKE